MSPPLPEKSPPAGPRAGSEAVAGYPSLRWTRGRGWEAAPERLAVEEPLAIEIAYERRGQPVRQVLAVTMRTPGADEELALGFLFGEGLIAGLADVEGAAACERTARGEAIAALTVRLARAPREDAVRASRGLLTTSACGLCGRSTLAGLPVRPAEGPSDGPALPAELIAALPERLRELQAAFARTGGTHGAGLCDDRGRLLLAREDVGRHNAVDKLIGAALRGRIAPAGKILVLSGRISFELTQKAAVAGISAVVAVGAPSSIAVDLARSAGITLVGFARGSRFNVYAHAGRLRAGEADPAPAGTAARI